MHSSRSPYTVVDEFEKRIAEWCGADYGVAVESGTAAIFLSLMYIKHKVGRIGEVIIPKLTYPSVPCSIIHAGGKVKFIDDKWVGEYQLKGCHIFDSALRFKKNMFNENQGWIKCLSFHIKKHLPIGRGGMILTNDDCAYDWFKKARFDGRQPIPLNEDNFTMLGWNAYMEPSQAARGIQLFEALRSKHPDGMEDLKVEDQNYPDLSQFPIYTQ